MEKKIYKHVKLDIFLLHVNTTPGGIHRFYDCDEAGNILFEERKWRIGKRVDKQLRITTSMKNLILIKKNKLKC